MGLSPVGSSTTGKAKGSITLAFWMCSKLSAAMECAFNVQQNIRPICSLQRSNACVFWFFMCVFSLSSTNIFSIQSNSSRSYIS
jgi:hypothetical protein